MKLSKKLNRRARCYGVMALRAEAVGKPGLAATYRSKANMARAIRDASRRRGE